MLKLALKNITENFLRTAAVIITVFLAAVMIYVGFIYKQAVQDEFVSTKVIEAENSDITIKYSPESSSRIITALPLNEFSDEIEFAVGVLDLYGTADVNGAVQYINIRGITEEGFNLINNVERLEYAGRDLRSDEIIISRSTSEALGLKLDSSISITVGDKTLPYFVAEIVEDHPCFESDGVYVIYGMENWVGRYIGASVGRVYNKIYVKAAPDADKQQLIDEIKGIEEYENYSVRDNENISSFKSKSRDISMPMIIALAGCGALSLYMVYLIFNAGLKRRTMFISRMKSIGADDNYISGVFILESILYVLAGVGLAVAADYLVLYKGIAGMIEIDLANKLYVNRIYISAALTGILAFLSIFIPIIKMRGVSVKAAYIYSKDTDWHGGKYGLAVSATMIIVSAVLVSFRYINGVRGVIAFVSGFLGILMLIPYLAKWISALIKKHVKDGVFFISAGNFGRTRSSVNNLYAVFAGIILCSVIISAANVTEIISNDVYNGIDCDIVIQNVDADTESQLNTVRQTEGIYQVYAFNLQNATIYTEDKKISLELFGMDPDELDDICSPEYVTPEDELIQGMREGLTLDYAYHKLYKINIGDTVTLSISDVEREVTVTGFYSTYQYGNRTGAMSAEYLSELFEIQQYNIIICKTDMDVDTAVNMLRAQQGTNNLIVMNKMETYSTYINLIANILAFVRVFTAFLIMVFLLSIVTNILNSRDETRSLKYRMFSMGFSRADIMLSELYEYLLTGGLVAAVSLLSVFLFNGAMTNLLAFTKIYLVNPISVSVLILINAGFTAALALIALTSYFIIRRDKLVETLKID